MTVGGWILYGVLVITTGIITGCVITEADNKSTKIISFVISAMVIISLFFGMRWYYQNTESGKRALKSQESNFNAGIERRVEVYDMEGELIKEYEGKFDVTYDDDRILFDDEKGKRHVIYYSTGTVVIDEV